MRKALAPIFLLSFALGGCARDVVLKPAVIAFNSQAQAAVDDAAAQYDQTIVRLNRQTADFLARNPDCGLFLEILPRRANPEARQTGSYCLSQAEGDALAGRKSTETLPIASRETFAAQFTAIHLLIDYISFLAKYADDPASTSKAEITATATAVGGLGKGLSDLKVATGGKPLKEFAAGGAVEKFGTALGDLAEQFELIAREADDVARLEGRIKSSAVPVNKAIDDLAVNADSWDCAAFERRQIDADAFAQAWGPKLPDLAIETRREVAGQWLAQVQGGLPSYCPGTADGARVGHGEVAAMLLAVKTANIELTDIANHKYTPAQRKAIAEATLARLGATLSRIAAIITLVP